MSDAAVDEAPESARKGVKITKLRKAKNPNRAPTENIGATLGTSGLRRSGGQVLEEFHRRLAGRRENETFREMRDNSPIVGAALLIWESLMLQADWPIEAPVSNPTPEQIRVRDFVRGARDDMRHPFSFHLMEAFTSLPFGWAYCETTYKVRDGDNSKFDDGMLGWDDIALRGQNTLDRWEWDEESGCLEGMWQTDLWAPNRNGHAFIPTTKAVHYRVRPEKDNPQGRSILRPGYRPYYMIKRLEEVEAIGIERDMAGLPIIEAPAEVVDPAAPPALQAIRQMLEKLVQDIRIDERMGAVIPAELDEDGKPTGYKLRLLTTGGRNSDAVHKAITRHETRLAMSLLAQFLLLGQQSAVGSFALASSGTNTLSIALGAFMDMIADVFTHQAINRLCALNGFPPETWPVLTHGDVETPPLAEFAQFLTAAGSQGFLTNDDAVQDRIRQWLGLPPREEKPAAASVTPADAAVRPEPQEGQTQAPAPATNEAAETAVVSTVALNGAQVQSAVNIVERVAQGQIPRDSGVAMLVGFFGLSETTADGMMGKVGTPDFSPAPLPQGV